MDDFIDAYKWTYAKTMPWYPHWYLVREKCANDEAFNAFIEHIHKNGVMMAWGRQPIRPYLEHKGYRYWTMTMDVKKTRIINREKIGPHNKGRYV